MRLFATIFFLLFGLQNAFCQLYVEQELHDYVVEDLENYQETITVIGENRSNSEESLGFLVNEDAELLNYQLFQRKGGKWKPSKLKKEMTISSIDRSSFFSGTRYYYFPIPSGMEFKLEFSTKEKHTIFLTKLYKSGWFDAEDVKYSFQVPDNLLLTTRGGHIFDGYFQISDWVYEGEPNMPYLIHPRSADPLEYFSSWFEDRIDPQLEIDPSLIPEELTKITETGGRLELAKACFQFVQQKIKYIDIENGINAIIPRQCEQTLKNGLGDCKDMATLLTALYRHFGFEAYSAISRTNDKAGVLNFPSIGLANHTICALRFEGEWYFLDATEDACLFGDASIQTLGSEVFLVGYDGDPFLDVDENPRSDSWAQFYYSLDEEMNLQLQLMVGGKMNHFFYHSQLKENDPSKTIKSVLDKITGVNWEISDVSIIDSFSLIKAVVPMSASMYSKMGSKTLYNLEFLADPIMMTSLFQNSRYPIFDGEVSTVLGFGGEIQNVPDSSLDPDLWIVQVGNDLSIKCKFKKALDKESFEKSSLISTWEEIIKKPLLIQYED